MAPEIDCYYSLSSPWAYFAGPKLQDIARRHNARVVFKPYDFQEIAPQNGGVPLRTRPDPRQEYHAIELDRWRRYLGMPLNLKPRHYPPSDNKTPGHTIIAAQHKELDAARLSHAFLRALWAEERDVSLPQTRKDIAQSCGMDGAALVEAESSAPVIAQYRRNTEQALQYGVFGAPTYRFDSVLYWGQDRLDFLDRALAQAAVAATR